MARRVGPEDDEVLAARWNWMGVFWTLLVEGTGGGGRVFGDELEIDSDRVLFPSRCRLALCSSCPRVWRRRRHACWNAWAFVAMVAVTGKIGAVWIGLGGGDGG